MADNDDAKAMMLAALTAKKAKRGGHKGKQGVAGGSKVQVGQRSGSAPKIRRKAGPSGSGAAS